MITYTKTIGSLQAYKELDGEVNVVYNINWYMVGTDGTYTDSCPATTYVPVVAGSSFIPFAELTEEIVMEWINTFTPLVLIEQYQNSINQLILSQQQLENPPLPWNPAPVPPVV
jgi:hypothetical protein